MSDTGRIDRDRSLLSLLDRWLALVEKVLNFTGGLAILALVLVSTANILLRKLFNAPIPGFVDWMAQVLPVVAFLGLAYAQRDGAQIRMDILVSRLSGRKLWSFELFSTVLSLLVALGLAVGTYWHTERAIRVGDSTADIGLPTWPAKLAVSLAFGLLVVRLLLQLWAYSRAILRNQQRPVAVPLPEDITETASREAAELDTEEVR